MSKLILLNKPYQVLSQYTDTSGRATLKDFICNKQCKIEGDAYPCGRLDFDSEGLILLTNDGKLQHRISDPKHKLPKTYWVQVEGIPTNAQLQALQHGVVLKDGITKPAIASCIAEPQIWERIPPIRCRKDTPTRWLELSITEGKNRQVRRMTAAVGLPTLRLIRYAIGTWTIDNLKPGEHRITSVHLPSTGATKTKNSHQRSQPRHEHTKKHRKK